MDGLTYILDGFIGIAAFLGIEFSIAFGVEEFADDVVSVADNAIAVEIVADVGA